MRVMQVMAGARHGGAEMFFERLVCALHRRGLEQRIVIRRNEERAARLRAGGLAPLELPFRGFFDLRTRGALKRAAVSFAPDVALTWMSRATGAFPARITVHCARLGGYYDLKYYRHCDHLIGNTPAIVDYLVTNGWPEVRAHYLPNFVPDRAGATASPRDELGVPAGAPFALALGRLHPNKAFDVLIRALAARTDLHLAIAGEGPERAALERLALDVGARARVHFLGWREDTAALLAAGDLVVCPSRIEPLGNVILEAWAQAVPVVAAAADGPASLIENGVSGLLVPVEDGAALAAAIGRVVDDSALRGELARGGRRAYEASFTEDAVVTRYLEFFDKVAG